MPSKIFGIGANKTGTMSLTRALELLGYRASHWTHHREIAHQLIDGNFKFDFLERYDALIDLPTPCLYSELDAAYPGSKFILTWREPGSWLESARRHYLRNPGARFETYLMYGCWRFDAELFLARYLEHNERVRDYFAHRPADLLSLDIVAGEGWDPLCSFLDRARPAGAFPYLNDRATAPSTG